MKILNITTRLSSPSQLTLQKFATALCFFCLGFSTAAWAPLIPFAQQRLHLDHSGFGIMLLCAGVGSMIAMPVAGKLTKKLGCRPILATVMLMFMVVLPCLALSSSLYMMAMSLFFFGAAAGALGVTINIQAAQIEKISGSNLMSAFHGICSLGGLMGVVFMTSLLSTGLAALNATLCVALIILAMVCLATPFNLSQIKQEIKPTNPNVGLENTTNLRPSFAILAIGVICFIAFLSEGAAMDWSAIYLTEDFHLNAAFAGLAYSFFAAMMVLGRFSGHWIIKKFGENRTITLSALLAGIGLMGVILAPVWHMVLLGYALLGLGSANIVPLMFSKAGRQQQMPSHIALSYVSVFAYTGSLIGPALVGFGSHIFGLSWVFALIAVGLCCIALLNHFTTGKVSNLVLEHFDQKTPA